MGRRYYRKNRRTSSDPLRDLVESMLALLVFVILVFCIFGVLSQPNAFKFSFGATPVPTAGPNATSTNIGGLEVIGLFGICAILIGAGGLVI
ncbi:MAG: hypothetical protein L0Y55_08305, partial [Anaerolineales bacterium]|nr:hypothetical protein [Anaerolineales bacterium]